jgi:glycine/D-amino acid oxidase-like deaminating enzyme
MIANVLDRADVAVVGAGTVGVSAAFFLADMGLDVVVVEREHIAWGASGRNAGFLWMHTRNPGLPVDLARAGIEIIETLSPDLGPIEFRRRGGMVFFETDAQRRVMEEFAASRANDGVEISVLDQQQARELSPLLPRNAIGATFCPEDGQINSPKFVGALAHLAVRKGVRIHEHTAVLSLLRDGDGLHGVHTWSGLVLADRVIWATGAWSGELEREGVAAPVRPSRIGVLVTAPVQEKLNVLMFGPGGAKQYAIVRDQPSFREEDFTGPWEDGENGFEYNELVAQREDGRIQIGNPEDDHGGFDQRTPMYGMKMMVDSFLDRWPHLAHIAIDGQWSGLIPVTPDALPIVDAFSEIPGLFLSAGHIYGNVAGPSSGRLIAQLANGETPFMDIEGLSLTRPGLAYGFDRAPVPVDEGEGAFVRW